MYTPAHIDDADPLMVSTYGKNSIGLLLKSVVNVAPASGTTAANRITFVPFYTSRGYRLARWWWQNGSVVGTDYVQVGIYDESFNLFRASPRTLSAGTVNQLQFANPGIHATHVNGQIDATDTTTYSMLSATLKAGVMYLLSVENSAASAGAVSSIDSATGGYPTFTSRSTTQFNTAANRISIWSAVPTTDWTGVLRVNFGATQTGFIGSLDAFFHVDTTTNDGIVQNAVGTGSSVTPLATLGAFGSSANATFGAFGVGASAGGTTSTGYIEFLDSGTGPPAQQMQVVFRPDNDTTVDETIVTNPWGACAVEIKSLGTGAVYVPPMRGWLAFHCSGATAAFFRRAQAVDWQSNVFTQGGGIVGLPAVGVPATSSVNNAFIVNSGFTRNTSP